MKISGTASLAAGRQQVWDAFHDPAVLARTLPGCERLVELGPDRWAMTVTAGVAAIKGTYDGEVSLHDPQEPGSFRMKASGSGAPGTVDADVVVRLDPSATGGTDVSYDADATVGGVVGGVGQRMLSGVTRKMAGQFFEAVDADIASGGAVAAQSAALSAAPAPTGASVASASQLSGIPAGVGTVYAGKATSAAEATRVKDFVMGTMTGGAIAIIGVLVGWAIGR